MKYPEIPIAIIDATYSTHDSFSADLRNSAAVASGMTFLAVCLTNPQLRAVGKTEEEAAKGLKELIKGHYGSRHRHVKYTTISFDDELVEEVMTE